jgi:hypothetical protein
MTAHESYGSGEHAGRKLFSLHEANELVPQFTEWFFEIHSLRHVVVEVIESKTDIVKTNGHIKLEAEETRHDMASISNAAGRITQLIDRINQTGAELKDLEEGLVDFLHRRDDRLVYLCWKFGEEEIGFWHELDAGASGRKPL